MAFAHALQSTRVVDADGALDGSELRRAAAALFRRSRGRAAARAASWAGAGSGASAPAGARWRPGAAGRRSCSYRRHSDRPSSRAVAAGLSPHADRDRRGRRGAHRGARPAARRRTLAVDGLPPLALIACTRVGSAADLAGAALVKLSSGSTGAPKAVVLTHANVAAEAATVAAALVARARRSRRRAGAADPFLRLRSRGARRARERRVVEQRPVLSPRRALADMADATVYLGVPAIYRVARRRPSRRRPT